VLLALQAVNIADTFQTQETLHLALQSSLLLQRSTAKPGEGFVRVVINPDNTHIAVVNFNPLASTPAEMLTTQVRDVSTLKVLSTLPGILVSDIWANSERLATLHLGDNPGHSMLTIWDADGDPVSETSLSIAWDDIHCPICLDAPMDYSLIAIALKDGSIAVFEQSSGGILQVLGEGEQFTLPRPRFSRNGELLAVGSDILIVWEVESGRELLRRSDASPFGAIDFHPNGQHIAYGPRRLM
jgi:WD40 repeat protein